MLVELVELVATVADFSSSTKPSLRRIKSLNPYMIANQMMRLELEFEILSIGLTKGIL